MVKRIFSQSIAILFLWLLSVACQKKELYVIHSPAPSPQTIACAEAKFLDTNYFKHLPIFDQSTVVDRGIGGGKVIDHSDTTFRCDSWNMNGESNIYRTFFGLPDLEALPRCAHIKKANLWIHTDQQPAYYVDNPEDSIQILLTIWPKDSIDQIKWLHFPAHYSNTLSVCNGPYKHNAWLSFDMTAVVQSIVRKEYHNNLFMMHTSGENMFIPWSRQKNLFGPKNQRQAFRPYLEIVF